MKRIVKQQTQLTLQEHFNQFLEEKQANNLSPSSIRNYSISWNMFSDYTGIKESVEWKQETIYQYINHLKNQEVSAASINHYLRDLRTFSNWLEKRGIPGVEIKEVRAQEILPKFFSEEDIAVLLEKPTNRDTFAEWRTYAIVSFILATGARTGTICNAKVSDIDFQEKTITYEHTKNKKAQSVPLSPALETVLREYLKMFQLDDYLFPNIGNEQLTPNALRHSFQRYCQERGVNQHNIHGLRHSFAKGFIKSGGNALALKHLLGHSSIQMTDRYVKLYGMDLREGYQDLSPLDVMKKNKSRTSKIKKNQLI